MRVNNETDELSIPRLLLNTEADRPFHIHPLAVALKRKCMSIEVFIRHKPCQVDYFVEM